ncbi:MAG: pyrroline-5-carboxylate reductase [Candidatus Micrarchaeia archaeon]
MKETIGFIGAGKMGSALVKGLLAAKAVDPRRIIVSDASGGKAAALAKELGVKAAGNNNEVLQKSDVVLVCVKPQAVPAVLEEIAGRAAGKLVISIAAGVSISFVEAKLPGARVARVMPNAPCLVGEGASAYALGKTAGEKDAAVVECLFGSVGKIVRVKEELLDAVTALSGCGPAYFYEAVGALAEAGERAGLPKDIALELAAQTCLGAGKMVEKTGLPPKELISQVATPGGATEAGMKELKSAKFREALAKAFEAAARRAAELGIK